MLKYQIISVTTFNQNCTLLWCDQTFEGVIVDPGGDYEKLVASIDNQQVKLTKVLLTHGHLDHVGAAKQLARHYQIPIEGPHKADDFWLKALPLQCEQFGLPLCNAFTPDQWLLEGKLINFGNEVLAVYHCPGHTPGHIVFFNAGSKLALVGDVLFSGSIGRTDFPLSNHDDLISSIRTKLWPLGDDVLFISGHGPMSSFAIERKSNPFVGDGHN